MFLLHIIFHNSDDQPSTNSGGFGSVSSNVQNVSDPNGLQIDGHPIENYLKSMM